MKLLPTLILAISLITISCNRSISYEDALTKNQNQFDNAEQLADARFLVESKSRNMLAVKILTLAADSAYSSVVVSFAKQSLPEHQKLEEEIQELSRKKDITLAEDLSPEHQIMLTELTSSSRKNFDNIFSKIITQVNEKNSSSFTVQATQASDPDIRAFAARKLDILRANSQSVESMQSQLLDTSE